MHHFQTHRDQSMHTACTSSFSLSVLNRNLPIMVHCNAKRLDSLKNRRHEGNSGHRTHLSLFPFSRPGIPGTNLFSWQSGERQSRKRQITSSEHHFRSPRTATRSSRLIERRLGRSSISCIIGWSLKYRIGYNKSARAYIQKRWMRYNEYHKGWKLPYQNLSMYMYKRY